MTITTTESIGFVGSGSGRMTVMVVGVVLVSKSTGNKGSVTNNYIKDIKQKLKSIDFEVKTKKNHIIPPAIGMRWNKK